MADYDDPRRAIEYALAVLGPALARAQETAGVSGRLPSTIESLPEIGLGDQATLNWLRDCVVPAGLPMAQPGHLGWIPTVPSTVGVAAQLVSSVVAPQKWWDHIGNQLEVAAIDWLKQLLGLPAHVVGALVGGGAAATLVCLAAARQHAGERCGIDIAEQGVGALARPRLYVSDASHHVIERAASILGFGRDAVVRIAAAHPGGVDVTALEEAMAADVAAGATPIAIVGTAGDANTGAIDDLDRLGVLARARGVWFHVDGCYGAIGVLDPRLEPRLKPMAAADSLTFDPHKWLGVPVGCGAAFVANGRVLERSLAMGAGPYVARASNRMRAAETPFLHFGDSVISHTIEHSAPARGVAVCAALAARGRSGWASVVSGRLDLARYLADLVEAAPSLQLVAEPVLSICAFRYKPGHLKQTAQLEQVNAAIVRRLHQEGLSTPSLTRVRNILVIRPCFTNPATTRHDVERLVGSVIRLGPLAEAEHV